MYRNDIYVTGERDASLRRAGAEAQHQAAQPVLDRPHDLDRCPGESVGDQVEAALDGRIALD
jgi:hypothetical protein